MTLDNAAWSLLDRVDVWSPWTVTSAAAFWVRPILAASDTALISGRASSR